MIEKLGENVKFKVSQDRFQEHIETEAFKGYQLVGVYPTDMKLPNGSPVFVVDWVKSENGDETEERMN